MLEKEFIKIWTDKIKEGLLKDFPSGFLNDVPVKEAALPGKMLILGPELFGTYEITDSKGNPILQTDNFLKVKYYLYANRTIPVKIVVPVSENEFAIAVKEYEKHLDSLVTFIEKDYKKTFPDSKSFHSVSNQIFSMLNLQRY